MEHNDMKSFETFVNELANLSQDERILFPMLSDCYTTLVRMQKECCGVTTLDDLGLHRYKPSIWFGERGDGFSPFVPIDRQAVLEEWNRWWNNKILSMGYSNPTGFLLDHGLEAVNGDPVVGDITWNQHDFGDSSLRVDVFEVDNATQVMIYDGEKWLDRKVRSWSHSVHLSEINVASNGVFRLSIS